MQPRPTYPGMTTVQSQDIIQHLITKHGNTNICWPVIFYRADKLQPLWLTFEVNEKNATNAGISSRFFRDGRLAEFFIDYLQSERQVIPLTDVPWPNPPGDEIIKEQYVSTYSYVMSRNNQSFNTIDIDYVWRTKGSQYFGLELSTFWVPMNNVNTARRLVEKFIERRPAVRNAHQFTMLAQVAQMQQISLDLVFVNVKGKDSNEILTEGNVFVIPIDPDTAENLHRGNFPSRYQFLSFREWLSTL